MPTCELALRARATARNSSDFHLSGIRIRLRLAREVELIDPWPPQAVVAAGKTPRNLEVVLLFDAELLHAEARGARLEIEEFGGATRPFDHTAGLA